MSKRTKSAICVVAAGSLWGMMGLLVRRMNAAGLSSMDICFLRALVTSVSMAAVLLIWDGSAFRIKLRDLWCFVGTGIVSMVSFNYFYFKTMSLTSLSVAAVLLYTAPVFVVLMSAPLFKERLDRRKLISALVAFLGCTFVSGIIGGAVRLSPVGILCGLAAGFGYALYSIFSRYALNRGYSSATISLYTFLFAMVASFFLADAKAAAVSVTASLPSLMVTVLLILLVTLFPYLLYTKGLQGLENGTASIFASIEPVVATLLGTLVYHEKLGIWNVVGIVLVLISIVIINSGVKKADAG